MSITKFDGILYGGDYCPEQWDEATWAEDIRIMKYYGVNAVTLNVHGWCVYQPEEGRYDFALMDKIVALLAENGIQIVMATGTAALPNWLLEKYPDMMATDIGGMRHRAAKRMNYCQNNPDFKRETVAMVEALAEHYRNQPNIILWHLSNELEGACYCETCARAYRDWLKKKYGSLDALNSRWNTYFWGHRYTSWEQINPPAYDNMVYRNLDGTGIDISAFPTETISYLRFNTDSYRANFELEKAAILKYIPDAVVTNNFQYRNFNYDKLSEPLDVVSYDSYPVKDEEPYISAFNYEIARSMKQQNPFLIMEMSPNTASWQQCAPVKRPGELGMIVNMALARGAESAMYFQIRRSRSGFEKFHGAMIGHAGREDTRIGGELKRLGDDLRAYGSAFLDSRIPSKAAILMDWENRWGVEIPSNIQKGTNYYEQVRHYYKWFFQRNIAVDLVRGSFDLSRYKILVAPMMYFMDEAMAENIRTFVENGGIFITTYYSGMSDFDDNIWLGGYPGLLKELLGMWVEETDALPEGEHNQAILNTPWLQGSFECGYMCDLIRMNGAEVIGTYGRDFYAGTPCITENAYGRGKAVYLGTKPDDKLLAALLGHYCEQAGVEAVFPASAGVEATIREGSENRFLFLINHNKEQTEIMLDGKYRLLAGGEETERVSLAPMGYSVLVREPEVG